jgi:hypothetical protein
MTEPRDRSPKLSTFPRPRAGCEGPAVDERLALTEARMRALLQLGEAESLSAAVTEFVLHAGDWWLLSATGSDWIRITHPAITADLDEACVWLRLADRAARDGR